jgi:tRNA threonylcarbamoyladenosine biosynthesis protein TsaB
VKVLGLDTSTLTSGIAIVDDERGVLAEARHDASGRTADLLVAIDGVCKRAGVLPTELDAIAIGAGPGSFTGLRIGMATAKGIAFAAGKPLWAVSSLAALAWDGNRGIGAGDTIAVLDARRGEVFVGCYRFTGTVLQLVGEERVLPPRDLAAWIATVSDDPDPSYVGDALAAHPAELAPLEPRWLAPRTPSGVAVARLALAGARTDILTGGAPTYIRPSEAEVKYPDGVPGALRRRDP